MPEGCLLKCTAQHCNSADNVINQMAEEGQRDRPQSPPGQFPLTQEKAGILISLFVICFHRRFYLSYCRTLVSRFSESFSQRRKHFPLISQRSCAPEFLFVFRSVEDEIFDIAYDYLLSDGITISVNIKNDVHFLYWVDTLPYYRNVKKEGIVLAG